GRRRAAGRRRTRGGRSRGRRTPGGAAGAWGAGSRRRATARGTAAGRPAPLARDARSSWSRFRSWHVSRHPNNARGPRRRVIPSSGLGRAAPSGPPAVTSIKEYSMPTICLIPGDGIGQEVVPATRRLLEATGLDLTFVEADAGWATFNRTGTSVPADTLTKVTSSDATLAGAFTSPSHQVEGHQGAIRYMRRTLDLFSNLRPARSRPVPKCLPGIDMLMVRENTEGLYVEKERRYGDLAIADAVVTRRASQRIARVAMEQARKRKGRVAVIHKANVLPLTSGLFLETVMAVAREEYPDVEAYDVIVDAAAMRLVRDPGSFDV